MWISAQYEDVYFRTVLLTFNTVSWRKVCAITLKVWCQGTQRDNMMRTITTISALTEIISDSSSKGQTSYQACTQQCWPRGLPECKTELANANNTFTCPHTSQAVYVCWKQRHKASACYALVKNISHRYHPLLNELLSSLSKPSEHKWHRTASQRFFFFLMKYDHINAFVIHLYPRVPWWSRIWTWNSLPLSDCKYCTYDALKRFHT